MGLRTSKALLWSFIAVVMLGLSSASAPYLRAEVAPVEYAKTFTATGLVERVRHSAFNKDVCTIYLANYRWVSLSEGFPLQDVPEEGDRYALRAAGATCQAVQVARAGAEGHIRFSAGEARPGAWFMLEAPEAASGCGGLLIDWQP